MTASDAAGANAERLDRWLWHARIVRTRVLSQDMIRAGRVRINGAKAVRPGQTVRVGDVLTIALGQSGSPRGRVRLLRIEAIAERRGPAAAAAGLFTDLTEPRDAPRADGRPGFSDRA